MRRDRRSPSRQLARLSDRAAASGTPWARGLLVRSPGARRDRRRGRRAVPVGARRAVAVDARDRAGPNAACSTASGCGGPAAVADAREPLQDALEFFETHRRRAASPSRAAAELAATGEHVRKPVGTGDTSSRRRKRRSRGSRPPASGTTTIAAQLYITTSTVEYHLRKVFVKLGVTSRTQLAAGRPAADLTPTEDWGFRGFDARSPPPYVRLASKPTEWRNDHEATVRVPGGSRRSGEGRSRTRRPPRSRRIGPSSSSAATRSTKRSSSDVGEFDSAVREAVARRPQPGGTRPRRR